MVQKSNSGNGGRWCVIYGSLLADRLCPKHGPVKAYLPFDPLAAAVVAAHCDQLGVVDVEAAC